MLKEFSWKKWSVAAFTVICGMIVLVMVLVFVFDPFFHYHAPLKGVPYILDNERYQNYGIAAHFDYDAFITGTSMCENFRPSQVDELFGTNCVKLTNGGAFFKETSDMEAYAMKNNPDVKMIIRSVDLAFVFNEWDYRNPEVPDPEYMYDNNPFNDGDYIFNTSVVTDYLPRTIQRTLNGDTADTFDEYGNFEDKLTFSKEAVLSHTSHPARNPEQRGMTDEEREELRVSIEKNFVANVKAHPDVQFYYFFPPYSVLGWYITYISDGKYYAYTEAMRMISEEMIQYDNVHLFTFDDAYDITTNLDNYGDAGHYSAEISDWIIDQMAADNYRLTEDNIDSRLSEIEKYYYELDYEKFYEE